MTFIHSTIDAERIIIGLQTASYDSKLASLIFRPDLTFILYLHCLNENAPIQVADPIKLLSVKHPVKIGKGESTAAQNGSNVHVSFHPNEIHVIEKSKDVKQLLSLKYHPQPFVKGSRLQAIFSSAHPTHLPPMRKKAKKGEYLLPISWESDRCMQVSIYELDSTFDLEQVDQIDEMAQQRHLVDRGKLRLLLTCKETNGDIGVWKSNLGIFGKPKDAKPMNKAELQRALDLMESPNKYDISALPDDAIIQSVEFEEQEN